MLDPKHRYWPRFREEDVWHLCAEVPEGVDARALFISNDARAVAIWHQRAARDDSELMGWDYHVILLLRDGAHWAAIDPDSTLPSPCPAETCGLDAPYVMLEEECCA